MKRKFRTRISCLLIASLCIGLLSATALAADPVGTEAPAAAETPAPSSGESTGTVEAPTVTKTVTTDTKQDTPAPDHDDHDNGEDVGWPRRHRGKRNDRQGQRDDNGNDGHRPGRLPGYDRDADRQRADDGNKNDNGDKRRSALR